VLIYYLIRKWSENGKLKGREYIAKTIVTTELMSDIATAYNVETFNVLTGFKFIADIMRINEKQKSFIAGAEESYGYLFGDFVRDKDAVMSCALIAETAAWAKDRGKSLYDILMEIYQDYGLYYESLANIYRKGKEGAEEIRQMMEKFRKSPPGKLGGSRVIIIHDYLRQESLDVPENKILPILLPKSNVLQYLTEDNSKVSIRHPVLNPKLNSTSVSGKDGS